VTDLLIGRLQHRDDFAGPGVTIEFRLLEDRRAITMHLEAAAAGWNQRDVGILELPLDLGRQTDGPRFVVSKRAVLDRDRHCVAVEGA
jgi:hypothetical protein